jgi:hypothetical protein
VQTWVGLTIAQVLAICATPYDEVQLVDEPPGKLRAVRFVCNSSTPPNRVLLEVEYRIELFSKSRTWPRALVEAQKVVAVKDAP